MKKFITNIPFIGNYLWSMFWKLRGLPVPAEWKGASGAYWEERYASGGNSGLGSYGKLARFKAEIINAFLREHNVESVIELGCGDGRQLGLMHCPKYLGFDVSATAVKLCRKKYSEDKSKEFRLITDYKGETADLALSLDVIFHLIEDHVFEEYMEKLFNASNRYVIIFSSNRDSIADPKIKHFRHRNFRKWVETHSPDWENIQVIRNRYPYKGSSRTGSPSDFYIYQKRTTSED